MTKKAICSALAILGLAVFAAPASAQDGPSITVDPPSVEAAGDHDLTVTGEGFSVDVVVLPCAPVEDFATFNPLTSCDLGGAVPASPDDSGSFSVTVSFSVPEEGLGIVVGDQAQTEAAFANVTIGAAADEGGGEGAEEELADTGVESGLLAVIAVAVVAAGALLTAAARRRSII
ncbi:MAG: hypothetical protein AAF480_16840 [Actinomycetota bacterium]